MNHQALARKWRPIDFNGVVGQDHVTRVLKNAFSRKRIHHAYLFSGTRGVGKTTIARILAKALNCLSPVSGNPCHQCDHCKAFDEGCFLDVIEIDAASKTKVEDTRELLDNVQYLPQVGKYKIYIIDEVHMLSTHSFNALLKTLEEPPEHVKFILATTNPDKLPVTVVSRCLHFALRHLFAKEIAKQMIFVLEQEDIGFEALAIEALATQAKGSMRDGLSLLDAAIMYSDETISYQVIQSMLGLIDSDNLYALLEALFNKDSEKVLTLSEKMQITGCYFPKVLAEMSALFHQLSMIKAKMQVKTSENAVLFALSEQVSLEDLQLFYQITLKGQQELNLVDNEHAAFEMILLRLLMFGLGDKEIKAPLVKENRASNTKEKMHQVSVEETQITTQIERVVGLKEDKSVMVSQDVPTPIVSTFSDGESLTRADAPMDKKAQMKEPLNSKEDWLSLLKIIHLTGLAQTVLSAAEFVAFSDGVLKIKLEKNQQAMVSDVVRKRMIDALESHLKTSVKLDIDYCQESLTHTYLQAQEKHKEVTLDKTKQALLNDSGLMALTQACDGEVLLETIQPGKSEL